MPLAEPSLKLEMDQLLCYSGFEGLHIPMELSVEGLVSHLDHKAAMYSCTSWLEELL